MDHTLASSRPASPLHASRRKLPIFLAAALAVQAIAPEAARGQLVDRGIFVLHLNGAEAGTEEFTIQREGTGDAQVTLATGTVHMRDGRTVTTILRLMGTDMMLNEYSAFATGPDTLAVRVVRAGSRLRTRSVSSSVEEERAYRARPSSVIFDEGIAHHYFVLNSLAGGATVHALAPLAERQEPAARLETGSEIIELGDERVETTRIRFGSAQRGGVAWFDGSGRLVRVQLEDRGFLAERVPGS